MGGIAKGIGKIFKAVGGFIKKYWKPILICVAAFFTCGLALGAFAPAGAAAFAGSTAAVEGATMTGMAAATATTAGAVAAEGAIAAEGAGAVAAGAGAAEAGTAFVATDAAAAAATGAEAGFGAGVAADLGGASAGFAGSVAGEGVVAGEAGAAGAAAGAGADAAASGGDFLSSAGTDAGNGLSVNTSTLDAQTTQLGQNASTNFIDQTASGVGNGGAGVAGPTTPAVGDLGSNASMLTKGVNAAKGFWGGMSSSEKMLTASTLFNAAAGLLKPGPTRAQQGLWPGGAYMGMESDGSGVSLGNVYNNSMTGGNASTAINATPATSPQSTTPQGQTASQATQSGSDQLATSSSAAAGAQATTQQQQSQSQQAAQKNSDFIQSTMQRLAPGSGSGGGNAGH